MTRLLLALLLAVLLAGCQAKEPQAAASDATMRYEISCSDDGLRLRNTTTGDVLESLERYRLDDPWWYRCAEGELVKLYVDEEGTVVMEIWPERIVFPELVHAIPKDLS